MRLREGHNFVGGDDDGDDGDVDVPLGGLLTRACEACEWCLETGSCSFLEVKKEMLKGRGMEVWSSELWDRF